MRRSRPGSHPICGLNANYEGGQKNLVERKIIPDKGNP
jgi:hypothetical protein